MKKIKYILLGLVGLFCFLIIWGLVEPYILDTEEEVAVIPNLPTAWQGQRIGLISDFQYGMWLDNTPTVRRSVAKLIEERPSVVLISGDFIYHAFKGADPEIANVVDLVRPLPEANISTYAVLGNHDYGMISLDTPPKENLAARLKAALEDVGIEVLENQAVELPQPGKSGDNLSDGNTDSFYLVGIGSHLANKDQPKVAIAQVPSTNPRIVMMHNPKSFPALPANTAPVAVAGHTHGGQIRLPSTPEWSWLALAKNWEHIDGWSHGYGASGNKLYVNRGIGFSDLPIRLNCSPEVTLFTLQSQSLEVGE
jgi:predicted MPP superfamily phosphohydrolase